MSEYYANIDDGYAAAVTNTGDISNPFSASEVYSLLSGVGANGVFLEGSDVLRLAGDVSGTNAFNLLRSITVSVTITSWPGRGPWILRNYGSTGTVIESATDVVATICDGVIGQTSIFGENGIKTYFYNCAFFEFSIGSHYGYLPDDYSQDYYFDKCTFLEDIELSGSSILRVKRVYFNDCVFIDSAVTEDNNWQSITFTGLNIFNHVQASVIITTGATVTGTGNCSFSYSVTGTPPVNMDVFTGVIDDFNYLDYGLPIVTSIPSAWLVSELFSKGWYDKSRYGYGAFYFIFDTNMSASVEYGAAPLGVQFSANATESLVDESSGYAWDFGDGEESSVKNPVHTFIPGEFTVSVTVTTIWGEEVTEYLTIYVYENDYSSGGRNVTKTTKIYRCAVPQEGKQGNGWSEYTGSDYPNAIGLIGTCVLFTDDDEERVIVTDCNSFKHYWLGKKDHWQDGANDSYGGSDFEADILFRELMPPVQATAKLKHLESEANIRPWLKERRNTGEYDAYGFRGIFKSGLYLREDSSPDDRAVVKYFPRKAQIISDRHVESESLQTGIRITGAPWRLVSIQQWNEQIDTAAAPQEKQMSEKTWAELLVDVIWVCRSMDLVSIDDGSHLMPWDHGSNQRTTGSYIGAVEGPDGNALSALFFGTSGSISVDEDIPSGDVSILLWVKSPANPCTILNTSELSIRLESDSLLWSVVWEGDTEVSISLDGSLDTWTLLTFVRSGSSLSIYQNGVAKDFRMLSSANGFSGPVTFYYGSVTGFEPRVIQGALPVDAIKWIYNDVIENNGNLVCGMY